MKKIRDSCKTSVLQEQPLKKACFAARRARNCRASAKLTEFCKRLIIILFFFTAFVPVTAQTTVYDGGNFASYLIPRIVYIGDQSRLVVTLNENFSKTQAFVSSTHETLTKILPEGYQRRTAPVVINRIELDRRSDHPRLLIDFIPYVSGHVTLPSILIAEVPPLEITGLSVSVASILGSNDSSLAEPAAPLAAPGTSLYVYSLTAIVLIIILFGIIGSIWSKKHFAFYKRRFYRRRLFRAMERLLKKLSAECSDGAQSAELFSVLSSEFREFLSLFSGTDCRALTSGEFYSIGFSEPDLLNSEYLSGLFKRLEMIRFTGSAVTEEQFLEVIDEVHSFLTNLDQAERSVVPAVAGGKEDILEAQA